MVADAARRLGHRHRRSAHAADHPGETVLATDAQPVRSCLPQVHPSGSECDAGGAAGVPEGLSAGTAGLDAAMAGLAEESAPVCTIRRRDLRLHVLRGRHLVFLGSLAGGGRAARDRADPAAAALRILWL